VNTAPTNAQAEPAAEWLSQLRDIHAAPEAPFWPPAPGWWLLAALLAALLGWLLFRAWKAWRVRRRRRQLAGRLDAVVAARDPAREPAAWLADVNQVLKWAAIRAFPGQCEELRGKAWAAFLAERAGRKDTSPFEALADGPYRPSPDFDPDAVHHAARQWVLTHG